MKEKDKGKYLKEITKEELTEIRINTKKVQKVIKVGNRLYLTNMSTISAFIKLGIKRKCPIHLCGNGNTCKHMNAGPNGCPLIKSKPSETLKRESENIREDLKKADCIENFPFIYLGYEIFNRGVDNKVIVIKCCNYQPEKINPKKEESRR